MVSGFLRKAGSEINSLNCRQRHKGDQRWCTVVANDATEQAHNLRDWQQEYDQLSGGAFWGRIDEYRFTHVRVFQEYTNQSLIQQCNVWPEAIWLGFSVNDQSCKMNGVDVNSRQLMLRPGDQQFELVTPENYQIFGIVIKKNRLFQCAEAQGINLENALNKNALSQQMTAQWDPKKLHDLRGALTQIITPYDKCSVQEDDLLTTVLNVLGQSNFAHKVTPSFHRRKAAVDQIRELTAHNAGSLLTITQLCREVNMSRRSLQYSFETVLGINPQKYLKITRLNQVRRQFKLGLEEHETIASVAHRCGFNHPGQFAYDYKQLFRESPSQTLARVCRH